MLQNFETHTEDITHNERRMALKFAEKMQHHIGEHRAVKSKKIEEHFKITGNRVRKMVNWLRTTGKCPRLMSTSKGYFIAMNDAELITHLQSLYDRGQKITNTAVAQAKHAGIDISLLTIKPQ